MAARRGAARRRPRTNQQRSVDATPVEIQDALARFRATQESSDSELVERLQELREHAMALRRTLEALSRDSRAQGLIAAWPTRSAVSPLALTAPLRQLITQVEHALTRAPKPRRGPRGTSPALRQLVMELAVLWSLENPNARGIVASKGERQGPMRDFVWKQLRQAQVPAQSEEALGKMLYSMRTRVAELARECSKKLRGEPENGRQAVLEYEQRTGTSLRRRQRH